MVIPASGLIDVEVAEAKELLDGPDEAKRWHRAVVFSLQCHKQ